jgi:hypothetical protein
MQNEEAGKGFTEVKAFPNVSIEFRIYMGFLLVLYYIYTWSQIRYNVYNYFGLKNEKTKIEEHCKYKC